MIKEIEFDIEKIVEALSTDDVIIKKEEIIEAFKDARISSRFTEIWASKIFKMECMDYNNEVYDLERNDTLHGEEKIQVKTIGRGNIKFQRSMYVGSGRWCSQQNLIDSINSVDYYIIVDVQEFPKVRFISIDSPFLIEKVKKGRLTHVGWNRYKFYREVIPNISL